jgi:hypothetical protein
MRFLLYVLPVSFLCADECGARGQGDRRQCVVIQLARARSLTALLTIQQEYSMLMVPPSFLMCLLVLAIDSFVLSTSP